MYSFMFFFYKVRDTDYKKSYEESENFNLYSSCVSHVRRDK